MTYLQAQSGATNETGASRQGLRLETSQEFKCALFLSHTSGGLIQGKTSLEQIARKCGNRIMDIHVGYGESSFLCQEIHCLRRLGVRRYEI